MDGIKPAAIVRKGKKNKFPIFIQNFSVTERNKVWCTDFTYILINGKMRYIVLIDLAKRESENYLKFLTGFTGQILQGIKNPEVPGWVLQ